MPSKKLLAPALLLACLSIPGVTARAQTSDRARAAAAIESLREQIKAHEAVLLAPSEKDRRTYAEFLSRPDTGLMRLLPREKWNMKLSTSGDGAYYSFTLRTNEYGRANDIGFEQGQLGVGFAGANFGFMLDLGEVSLEDVSEETEAVRFMASYKAPEAEAEARAAKRQFGGHEGHQAGPWIFRSRVPAVEGHTYALRSISYRDSDVLVAFRVVRKDTDGSVVLLWKILKTYPKPAFEPSAVAVQ